MAANFRYFLRPTNNDPHGEWAVPTRWIYNCVGITMATTPRVSYTALSDRLRGSAPLTQALKNRLSALKQVMRLNRRAPSDCAYADLVTNLNRTLNEIAANASLSDTRRRDLRSHARWLSQQLTGESPKRANYPAPRPESKFTSVLIEAFEASELKKSQVAASAGLSPATFGDWLRGRQPRAETISKIALVESTLGIAAGSLSRHVRLWEQGVVLDPCSAYRRRVCERQQARYRGRCEDLSPEFVDEWKAFLRARTGGPIHSSLPRSGWSLKPQDKTRVTANVLNSLDGKVSPAADVISRHVLGLIGWLCLPEASGGRGYAVEDIRTIAWLCIPGVINGYLEFIRGRADKVNNAPVTFAGFIGSLCAREYGYFRLHPELLTQLPTTLYPLHSSPEELIQATLELAQGWRARYEGRSRDPKLALRSFTDPDGNILKPLWRGVKSLDEAATRLPAHSSLRASRKRDALLLALLLSVPLRAETLATIQVGGFSNDVLYRGPEGYRLRVTNVKNRRTKDGQSIDVRLPAFLEERIDEYLEKYREILIRNGASSSFLFVNQKNPEMPWARINNQVISITRAHVPSCPGVGTHAFRHCVATEYLRRHRGEHATVARLLMVDLQTVLTHYDQNPDDYAFDLHAADLDAVRESLVA
jgi:integrase/transcriptional regulator with XRE-family HTH domain